LKVGKFNSWKLGLETRKIAFKRFTAIHFGLSLAEQVEVGAVDYLDFHAYIEKN
jgi:hypothetical protein